MRCRMNQETFKNAISEVIDDSLISGEMSVYEVIAVLEAVKLQTAIASTISSKKVVDTMLRGR